jgi:hypothetical protein
VSLKLRSKRVSSSGVKHDANVNVMIIKYFRQTFLANYFFSQNYVKLIEKWIITLVFQEKRQFFRPKLAKIAKKVIITLTHQK